MTTDHRTDSRTSPLLRPRFGLIHLALVALIPVALAVTVGASTMQKQVERLTFQSPLPNAWLSPPGPALGDKAYRQDYDFSTDWFTPHIPVWTAALNPYQGQPGLRYLEVGLFEGRSALWMLENVLTDPDSRVVGIDPFLVDGTEERWRLNLDLSGASDRVTTLKGFSGDLLPTLPESEPFDIIYIDGSHQTADVLEDAVLSWRLLKPGGILIFDDYRWIGAGSQCPSDTPTDFPKHAIDAFVQCQQGRLDVLHNGNQLIVRKHPAPTP